VCNLLFVEIGGVLPFGSIFIEIYFIFTSFWGYKNYFVFGFMLLVFVILIIVTACVSVVSTCIYISELPIYSNSSTLDFLLNSENHRWHWISFLASGSTACYVMLYSVYYFNMKTK
jgi:transmembrane 9 superfamily member 3